MKIIRLEKIMCDYVGLLESSQNSKDEKFMKVQFRWVIPDRQFVFIQTQKCLDDTVNMHLCISPGGDPISNYKNTETYTNYSDMIITITFLCDEKSSYDETVLSTIGSLMESLLNTLGGIDVLYNMDEFCEMLLEIVQILELDSALDTAEANFLIANATILNK